MAPLYSCPPNAFARVPEANRFSMIRCKVRFFDWMFDLNLVHLQASNHKKSIQRQGYQVNRESAGGFFPSCGSSRMPPTILWVGCRQRGYPVALASGLPGRM
jgi:hypothetical protein